jgi:hypothetical protein
MKENKAEDREIVSPAQRLLGLMTGSWMTQAVYVAAELRIADYLAERPRTSEELAAATGAHAPSLHRLLRALTTIEICRERKDGTFEITETGLLLKSDVPGSLRSWTIWWGEYLWPVWGNLLYSVKTGESARKMLSGMDGFKHLENDPKAAAIFNEGLAELTRLTAQDVVRVYDFSGIKRIVDVGGGHGELLISILRKNPKISGVLFDMSHAIAGGRRHFEEAGLIGRCEFAAGDFFESVPKNADAYILKSVIHDWNDEDGKRILANCRLAMAEKGRLLLVERIVPERLEVSADHQAIARTDLGMLVALAAKERTEAQFKTLLKAAGLRVTRIIPVGMTFSVIEAFADNF